MNKNKISNWLIATYTGLSLYLLAKTVYIIHLAANSAIGLDDRFEYERFKDQVILERKDFLDLEYVYGLVPGAQGYIFNYLFNPKFINIENIDLSYYQYAHIAVALTATIGVALTVILGKLLSGSYLFGLISASILVSIPKWESHSFFNIKDIPVATGVILFTTGLAFVVSHKQILSKYLEHLCIFIFLSLGFIFVVGTRPALALLLLAQIFLILLLFLLKRLALQKSRILVGIGAIFTSLLPTYFFLPQLRTSEFQSWLLVLTNSSRFPWPGRGTLTNGKIFENATNLEYLLFWYFGRIPFSFWLIMGIALVLALYSLKIRHANFYKKNEIDSTVLFLILITVFLLPIYIILNESILYNGVRLLLFTFPGLAILISLGFFYLLGFFTSNLSKRILLGMLVIGLVVPSYEAFRLRPYGYIYVNPIVSAFSDISTDWETDYWMYSLREANSYAPKYSRIESNQEIVASFYMQERSDVSQFDGLKSGEFYVVMPHETVDSNMDSKAEKEKSGNPIENLPPKCNFEKVITRQFRFEKVPFAYLARCRPSGLYIENKVSISWLTMAEVDVNNQLYFWLTDNGDEFRISNFQNKDISGIFAFTIKANPCGTPQEIEISDTLEFSKVIKTPSFSDRIRVKIPLVIERLGTQKIQIKSDDLAMCEIEGDSRKFIAEIRNIDWKQKP